MDKIKDVLDPKKFLEIWQQSSLLYQDDEPCEVDNVLRALAANILLVYLASYHTDAFGVKLLVSLFYIFATLITIPVIIALGGNSVQNFPKLLRVLCSISCVSLIPLILDRLVKLYWFDGYADFVLGFIPGARDPNDLNWGDECREIIIAFTCSLFGTALMAVETYRKLLRKGTISLISHGKILGYALLFWFLAGVLVEALIVNKTMTHRLQEIMPKWMVKEDSKGDDRAKVGKENPPKP